MTRIIRSVGASVLVLCSACALANSAADSSASELRGYEIIEKMHRTQDGFGDVTSDMTMILRDSSGAEQSRRMRSQILEQENDGDKSIIIFDSPGNVKGTAFLSHTHKVDVDDQWIFLPALKKVKRIASNNKAGSFMNSEFAYEDIASQEIEKYTYDFLREETLGNELTYIVEQIPVDSDSGYSRQEVWVDAVEYRPYKIMFYDRAGQEYKKLELKDYQQRVNDTWWPNTLIMENYLTGKSTELRFDNWAFNVGLSERDFSPNGLKRLR
ncbi:outer membrane lipoprotein-sorting protein [Aurantivibrio plasticivorans]